SPPVFGAKSPVTHASKSDQAGGASRAQIGGDPVSKTPHRVTGDSRSRKKAGKRRAATTKKPTLPGYEFVPHGAGWKVFRVAYSQPLPGPKWKRKWRQHETHLTNKDVE